MTAHTTRSPIARRHALVGLGSLALVVACAALGLPRRPARADPRLKPVRCPETECGHLYDPGVGEPSQGIPPGVAFEDLPDDWECPECGTPKYLW